MWRSCTPYGFVSRRNVSGNKQGIDTYKGLGNSSCNAPFNKSQGPKALICDLIFLTITYKWYWLFLIYRNFSSVANSPQLICASIILNIITHRKPWFKRKFLHYLWRDALSLLEFWMCNCRCVSKKIPTGFVGIRYVHVEYDHFVKRHLRQLRMKYCPTGPATLVLLLPRYHWLI